MTNGEGLPIGATAGLGSADQTDAVEPVVAGGTYVKRGPDADACTPALKGGALPPGAVGGSDPEAVLSLLHGGDAPVAGRTATDFNQFDGARADGTYPVRSRTSSSLAMAGSGRDAQA